MSVESVVCQCKQMTAKDISHHSMRCTKCNQNFRDRKALLCHMNHPYGGCYSHFQEAADLADELRRYRNWPAQTGNRDNNVQPMNLQADMDVDVTVLEHDTWGKMGVWIEGHSLRNTRERQKNMEQAQSLWRSSIMISMQKRASKISTIPLRQETNRSLLLFCSVLIWVWHPSIHFCCLTWWVTCNLTVCTASHAHHR